MVTINSSDPEKSMPWATMFAGLSASMIGIGLARFAYTPLIPPLIEAGWFSADNVIYLSAANLAGYLAGALVARRLGRLFGNVMVLKAMMLLTALAFLACAFPVSVAWFFAWRLLSGITGGIIMVLVAATLLPSVPAPRRGLASGAIFFGVGVGIAASGTIVPALLHWGLSTTWEGLAAISLALIVLSWRAWPANVVVSRAETKESPAKPAPTGFGPSLLYVQYGLMAVGLVPAVVFLADFIARGRDLGANTGAIFWIVYGVGAMFGPLLYGQLADRVGSAKAARLLLAAQIAALLLFASSAWLVAAAIATWVIGTFPPGIVPLTLHKVHHMLPDDHGAQAAVWSRATVAFAAFQAIAGYGSSWLFAHSNGNYTLLFLVGAGALALALAMEFLSPALKRLSRAKQA